MFSKDSAVEGGPGTCLCGAQLMVMMVSNDETNPRRQRSQADYLNMCFVWYSQYFKKLVASIYIKIYIEISGFS